MVGALIGAVDRVEPCPYVGVGGDGTQLPQAVRRSVERGDRNREWVQVIRPLGSRHLPTGVGDIQRRSVGGLGVEPEEAAIEQSVHAHLHADLGECLRGINRNGLHGVQETASRGTHERQCACTLHLCGKAHGSHWRPATPIACRECIEIRAERGMPTGMDCDCRATGHCEHGVRGIGDGPFVPVEQPSQLGLVHCAEIQ